MFSFIAMLVDLFLAVVLICAGPIGWVILGILALAAMSGSSNRD